MENKGLQIFAVCLAIGFVLIVNFAFFGVQSNITSNWTNKFTQDINHLEHKVDSLEGVINTKFKQQRDTIIVDVRPQTIRIYQQK